MARGWLFHRRFRSSSLTSGLFVVMVVVCSCQGPERENITDVAIVPFDSTMLPLGLGGGITSLQRSQDSTYLFSDLYQRSLIDADGRIQLDGMSTRLEELTETFLANVQDKKANVMVTIAPLTPMGMVFDISNRLPLDHVSSISYATLTDL